LTIGLKDKSVVVRSPGEFYCNMTNTLPGRLSAIIVTVIMIICVCLDVYICIVLRRYWHLVSGDLQASLATVMRVMVFSAFSVVSVVLGLVFFFTPLSRHGPALNIVLSVLPFAAVFVFGTQKDLVRSWKAGFQGCFHSIQACGCRTASMLVPVQHDRQTGEHGHGCSTLSPCSSDSMMSVNSALTSG